MHTSGSKGDALLTPVYPTGRKTLHAEEGPSGYRLDDRERRWHRNQRSNQRACRKALSKIEQR